MATYIYTYNYNLQYLPLPAGRTYFCPVVISAFFDEKKDEDLEHFRQFYKDLGLGNK